MVVTSLKAIWLCRTSASISHEDTGTHAAFIIHLINFFVKTKLMRAYSPTEVENQWKWKELLTNIVI